MPAETDPAGAPGLGRLVKILERPTGQQFAPFQGLLESGIAVGYVFLPGAQFVACKLAPQPIWASRAHSRWACRSPPAAHGSEASPAARNTLDSAWIPRASKLLICGLFQKGRVLAQDGLADLSGIRALARQLSWVRRFACRTPGLAGEQLALHLAFCDACGQAVPGYAGQGGGRDGTSAPPS